MQQRGNSRRRFLRGNFSSGAESKAQAENTIRPIHHPSTPRTLPTQTNARNQAMETPPLSVLVLNRAGFGPRPGDIAAFEALGTDDDARLAAYVAQQIDYTAIDDQPVEDKLTAAGFITHNKSLTQLWSDHLRNGTDWHETAQPGYESRAMKFVRAIHSKRQLHEAMVDFWHNHFSIYLWDDVTPSIFMQFDLKVIRPNALGNFHDLLVAVAQNPCMLFYLDNVFSSVDGPNENYARELLELHTLGSEHYYGQLAPENVPGYPNPVGYVEEDVFAVTKALTGWSIKYMSWISPEEDTGEFVYRDDWHDTSEKQILGQTLPANQTAEQDGNALFDILAAHPATATFVCRKLVRRFIADSPPESLVASAAAIFNANVDAPNQIALVMEHILLSAEFRTSWGQKMKRPFEAAVSAMRAGDCDYTFRYFDDELTNHFIWLYNFAGHMPFEWHSPNGYPDIAGVWQSTSSLLMRWRSIHWLPDGKDESAWLIDILGQTPTDARSANALTDFWIERIFGYVLNSQTRQYLVDFMAQGRNPAYDLPFDTEESIQDRLRALVGLMFMTPEFQTK